MAIIINPFSLEIPVQIGPLNVMFFINENLYVTNTECISSPHNHHDYELRYIESGNCKQIIENKVYHVSRHDLLLVHPFEYHCQDQFMIDQKSCQFNLRFYIKEPNNTSPKSHQKQLYNNIIRLLNETRYIHDKRAIFLPYLRQIFHEIHQKKDGYIYNLQALCLLVLTELVRLAKKKEIPIFPEESLKYRGSGYERARIDGFFRRNFLTNATAQDLAEELNISMRQVNRILNRIYGISFTQKIIEMRLQEAAHQIITTDKPISAISHDCGFKNYNYFFKCFKKHFQITPREFYKQYREV